MTETEIKQVSVSKLEKGMVIGILGGLAAYNLYLGNTDAGNGLAMSLVTYFLSREGV